MIGSGISKSMNVSPQEKREISQRRVEETADELGMDLGGELMGIDVGELGPYKVAATVPTPTGAKVIFDQSNFFRKSEADQKHTAGHELGHVKQFNNSLDTWAQEEFNVSDEFAEELGNSYDSVADMEGEVEVLLDNLFPEHKSSYPYWKYLKEREWKSKGLEPESELVKDIEELKKDVLSEYREVYISEAAENLYVETGAIDGTKYTAVVYGPEAETIGEKIVEDYLSEFEEDYEGLAGDIRDYISEVEKELAKQFTDTSEYEVEYGKGDNTFDLGELEPDTDKTLGKTV